MISAMPNRPIETTTTPMPSRSSGRSKVKRSKPVLTSAPIRPSSRPRKIAPTARSGEPCAKTTAATRPSAISEKYSAGPNFCASSVRAGLATAISSVTTVPAKKEASAAVASAVPARPLRAMA